MARVISAHETVYIAPRFILSVTHSTRDAGTMGCNRLAKYQRVYGRVSRQFLQPVSTAGEQNVYLQCRQLVRTEEISFLVVLPKQH